MVLFDILTSALESDRLYSKDAIIRYLSRVTDAPQTMFNQALELGWLYQATPDWFTYDKLCWLPVSKTFADRTIISVFDAMVNDKYLGIKNTTIPKNQTLREVYNVIRSDKYKPETIELRQISDAVENKKYKMTRFNYCTFSGTFSSRHEKGLICHSGLICIDLDHLGIDLKRVCQRLRQDEEVVMFFISPNGDGLKIIFEVDLSAYTQKQGYEACSAHLVEKHGISTTVPDQACKDIARACFLSADPDAYLNPKFSRLQ